MSLVEKQSDLFTRAALASLLAEERGPCVSIFMPTYRKGVDTQQGPIRLKNLLAEAEAQLVALDERTPNARELLAPAQALVENSPFWQQQSTGLALFLSSDATDMATFRVPLDLEELVVVGERFHVKPLLPLLSGEGSFYLLALNQSGVRLYQGSRFSLSAIELADDTPKSLDDELRYDEFEPSLQFHSGTGQNRSSGERNAMFFGSGDEGDAASQKQNILRFFQHLDDGVRSAIPTGDGVPLVLAGLEVLQGIYRQANEYKFLLEDGVEKDVDTLSLEELHAQTWPLVEPIFQQARGDALDAYHHLVGNSDARAGQTLEEIVSAAYFQRIDTLFTTVGTQRWGHFDADANRVELYDEAQPGAEELLDFVAVHTLLNGGAVYVLDSTEMPNGAPLAAIFRY